MKLFLRAICEEYAAAQAFEDKISWWKRVVMWFISVHPQGQLIIVDALKNQICQMQAIMQIKDAVWERYVQKEAAKKRRRSKA